MTVDAQKRIPNEYLSRVVCHIDGCDGGKTIKRCVLATTHLELDVLKLDETQHFYKSESSWQSTIIEYN